MSFYYVIITTALITAYSIAGVKQKQDSGNKVPPWRFKDFMEKYDTRIVWDRVKKEQVDRNLTEQQFLDKVVDGLDFTDQLLRLKVHNISTPLEKLQTFDDMMKGARRSLHLVNSTKTFDHFHLRERIYELMKQAIYQIRNEMVIMQFARKERGVRFSKPYKMGFLMCKTDNAVKTFYKFAIRAIRLCGLRRVYKAANHMFFDMLLFEERLLNLWFNAQLLTKLVQKNHQSLEKVLRENNTNRLVAWKFQH